MTTVIARVHPVHLTNADEYGWPPTSDQANRLGLMWVRWKLAISTYPVLLLLSPWADTYFTFPRRVEGWVDLGTAVKVCSPYPRLHVAAAVAINTTALGVIRTLVLTPQSDVLTIRPLRRWMRMRRSIAIDHRVAAAVCLDEVVIHLIRRRDVSVTFTNPL